MDIKTQLMRIIEKREYFYSEDDLKFEFAWQVKLSMHESNIFLEKPYDIGFVNREGYEYHINAPIDIIIEEKGKIIPVELKYKTTAFNNELYSLRNQNGYPESRFRFRRDIYRIEKLKKNKDNKIENGFCIFVTNDIKYTQSVKSENFDFNYSIGNNETITKEDYGWNYKGKNIDQKYFTNNMWINTDATTKHWTCNIKDNFLKLDLENNYPIQWDKIGNLHICILKI